MVVVVLGGGILATAFVVHVIIWRLFRPKNSSMVLPLVFLSVLMAGMALVGVLSQPWLVMNGQQWVQLVLLYLTGASGYINTYPAIEVDSPTLKMFHAIWQNRKTGVALEDLHRQAGDEFAVRRRLDNLVNDRMARWDGEHLVIEPKGRAIATVFTLFRRLVGRGLGG